MVRCFPADWLHPQPPLTPTIGPSRQGNAIGVWTPCAGLMLGLVSCPVMGVLSSLFYEGRSGQSTAQAHTAKTRLSLDSNSGLSDSVLCPQPHTPRPSWEQERLPGSRLLRLAHHPPRQRAPPRLRALGLAAPKPAGPTLPQHQTGKTGFCSLTVPARPLPSRQDPSRLLGTKM